MYIAFRSSITQIDFLYQDLSTSSPVTLAQTWPPSIPQAATRNYPARAYARKVLIESYGHPLPDLPSTEPAVSRTPLHTPRPAIVAAALIALSLLCVRPLRRAYRPINLATLLSLALLAASTPFLIRSRTMFDQFLFCTPTVEHELASSNTHLHWLHVADRPSPYPPSRAAIALHDTSALRDATWHNTLLTPDATSNALGITIESGRTNALSKSAPPFRRITVPWWLFIAFFSLLPAMRLLRAAYLPLRAHRRKQCNHCPSCNYNLHQIASKTCPECGHPRA